MTMLKGKVRVYKFKTGRPLKVVIENLETYPNKPVETIKYKLSGDKLSFEYYTPSLSKYKKFGPENVIARVSGEIDFKSKTITIREVEEEDALNLLLDLLTYVLGGEVVLTYKLT